jgi:hypothetical protein
MKNPRLELDVRCSKGILCRKLDGQVEYTAAKRTIIRAEYTALPVEEVLTYWTCTAG